MLGFRALGLDLRGLYGEEGFHQVFLTVSRFRVIFLFLILDHRTSVLSLIRLWGLGLQGIWGLLVWGSWAFGLLAAICG